MAIERQRASGGSRLVTPLQLTGGDVPDRTSDEVKNGSKFCSSFSFFIQTLLEIFHSNTFHVVTKRTSDSQDGKQLMSSVIHVKSLI